MGKYISEESATAAFWQEMARSQKLNFLVTQLEKRADGPMNIAFIDGGRIGYSFDLDERRNPMNIAITIGYEDLYRSSDARRSNDDHWHMLGSMTSATEELYRKVTRVDPDMAFNDYLAQQHQAEQMRLGTIYEEPSTASYNVPTDQWNTSPQHYPAQGWTNDSVQPNCQGGYNPSPGMNQPRSR